jgi:hypothetical protein
MHLGFGDGALVGGVLELGQLADHLDDGGLVTGPGRRISSLMCHSQPGQDGPELRGGLVEFVTGIGFGDDPAAAVCQRAAAVGGQLRTADRHHPASVAGWSHQPTAPA